MERRDVIKMVALATGATLSTPLLSSLLVGCKKETTAVTVSKLHFFNESEFELIKVIVDLILPKTDSPSATEVGVDIIIDTMVGTVYRPNEKESYAKNFSELTSYLQKQNFLDSNEEKQVNILQNIDNETAKAAYLDLKQQTIAYYLSTEEIATKHLNYLPIPGKFEPCISVEEAGGKAWAI